MHSSVGASSLAARARAGGGGGVPSTRLSRVSRAVPKAALLYASRASQAFLAAAAFAAQSL